LTVFSKSRRIEIELFGCKNLMTAKNKLHFIKKTLILSAFLLAIFSVPAQIFAQEVVDKTVATVSDGVNTELITYSDLVWHLALEPDVSLTPPTSEDLNRTLQMLINQRLLALEVRRLPSISVKEDELKIQRERILENFATPADFEKRLRAVGFDSISDENFQRTIEQRAKIEKYLDFRFRSFVVVKPDEEAKYFRDVFAPNYRKQNPGLLMPTFTEIRPQINKILTEIKIGEDIEKFLDNAKDRAEIIVLSEV
jgi:hypothetical protein